LVCQDDEPSDRMVYHRPGEFLQLSGNPRTHEIEDPDLVS
jgi:hypothetical protein